MNALITIRCPHCGHENRENAEFKSPCFSYPEVLFCDIESGGCDKPFAVWLCATPQYKVAKIEEPTGPQTA